MTTGSHAMLSSVLDIVKSTLEVTPFGDHTYFAKMAKTEMESTLSETLHEIEATEEEKQSSFGFLNLVMDSLSLFVREAKNSEWRSMPKEQRMAKVQALQALPQIPQRSDEWFRQFGKILTASEFSAVFVTNKRRRDLVYSKANPPTDVNINFRHACPTESLTATSWGIRFEPVVKQLLEHRDKWKIYESGRIHHKTNTHLAASPDGIVESAQNPKDIGKLVEIKCPYSRTIGKEIPSDYWIQMQIQMEVTDLDECEYVECTIVSKKPNQDVLDLSGTTYQGFVYLCKPDVPDGEPFEYQYLYGEIGSQQMPELPEGYVCVETIPWGLQAWHRKLVSRDRAWYEATIPWQEAFWRDVELVKQGNTLEGEKKEACLITDD
jgi:hypothetical protein